MGVRQQHEGVTRPGICKEIPVRLYKEVRLHTNGQQHSVQRQARPLLLQQQQRQCLQQNKNCSDLGHVYVRY